MRMAKPGEVLYTEGHRYPRSRRTGGKKKLEEENEILKCKGGTPEKVGHEEFIQYLMEENKRLRKGIDIRLDSMGVKYIITEEGDYFAKSDFKITELFK